MNEGALRIKQLINKITDVLAQYNSLIVLLDQGYNLEWKY